MTEGTPEQSRHPGWIPNSFILIPIPIHPERSEAKSSIHPERSEAESKDALMPPVPIVQRFRRRRRGSEKDHAVIAPQTPAPPFPQTPHPPSFPRKRESIQFPRLVAQTSLPDCLSSLDSAFHGFRDLVSNRCTVMHGAMGLGRKDGNTGSFYKNGWIPAFAGMTEGEAFPGMMKGVGICGNDGGNLWTIETSRMDSQFLHPDPYPRSS